MVATAPHKILFPVETAARELLYKVSLACRFAQLGHECYLGSKNEIYKLFSMVSPFIYFDKGYHPKTSESIYQEVKRLGGIIVNLDEEGGVDFKHSKTISSRYPETVFELCDLILIWGESQFDMLKKQRKSFDERKTFLSGHPRFELLKPQFHGLYKNEVDKIKARFGNYILLNTNMGFGNNIRGDGFVRNNYGKRIANINEVIKFDKVKLAQIISFVKKLAVKIDKEIVLRPHPEENHDAYKKAFQGLSNVHVLFEGSAIPWLIGAEVMIHPDCTTGIESMMVGKRSISLLPEGDESLCTYATVEMSKAFRDEDDLIEYLVNGKHINDSTTTDDPLLNKFFAHYLNSSEAICREVTKFLVEINSAPVRELPGSYKLKSSVKTFLSGFYHSFKGNEAFKLQENKLKGFDPENMNSIFNTVKKESFNGSSLELKEFNHHLYKIS